MEEITIAKYLKNSREKQKKLSMHAVSDSSKMLYPSDEERQISASYLSRVEDGLISVIHPKKLQTLAAIYEVNFYYLLYLAGYIDENPEDMDLSNELLLQKTVDVEKLLNDPKIRVHFSGNPLDEDKKKAVLSVLKIIIGNSEKIDLVRT
jgi:hypothetical protein